MIIFRRVVYTNLYGHVRKMGTKRALVWFKSTDLRLADSPVLHAAHSENDAVSHLYVFDPFWFGKSRRGYPKCGYHRAKFLLESVADLRKVSRRRARPVHDVSCALTSTLLDALRTSRSSLADSSVHLSN